MYQPSSSLSAVREETSSPLAFQVPSGILCTGEGATSFYTKSSFIDLSESSLGASEGLPELGIAMFGRDGKRSKWRKQRKAKQNSERAFARMEVCLLSLFVCLFLLKSQEHEERKLVRPGQVTEGRQNLLSRQRVCKVGGGKEVMGHLGIN